MRFSYTIEGPVSFTPEDKITSSNVDTRQSDTKITLRFIFWLYRGFGLFLDLFYRILFDSINLKIAVVVR